eukprot:CAMPEP_0182832394 /NCGR_PEP_ID=MMETSP0006_2-20121128/19694_1 /TAXON_ID=97485 /ORGANISM="Prymnesium parvum, Strain Texoma1" /LENGTH=216 /DNA_ID=CAMNT_0024960243 /DNA_START=68 /DNA_END=716 /DNA_ORIENTATION=+
MKRRRATSFTAVASPHQGASVARSFVRRGQATCKLAHRGAWSSHATASVAEEPCLKEAAEEPALRCSGMEVDRESDGQPRARDVRLLVVAHDPEHLGAGRGAVVRRRRIDAAEGGMDDVRRAHGGEVRGVRAHRPHHLIERHRAQQRARLVELAHGRAHPLDRRLAVTPRRHDQVDARQPVAPELRVAVEVEAPRQRVATQVDPDDRVDAQRLQRL